MDTKTAYQKKLLDPRWQRKRLEILQRDEFKCRECGEEKKTLHIHHLSYNENPWEVDSADLLTVCKNCHFILEEYKKNNKSVLIKIIRRDFVDINGIDFYCFTQNKETGHQLILIYQSLYDEQCKLVAGVPTAIIMKFIDTFNLNDPDFK